MRLRNITGSTEMIAKSKYVINQPEENKGHWREVFNNNNRLHIEIGMGKGQFLTAMALEHPDINYIGIEKYSAVLLRAVEKMEQLECSNIRFIRYDAEYITSLFAKDEVDRIYLNFSDPWPKDRHSGRRLTSSRFMEKYSCFLKQEGHVAFKTDNRPLFDFSLEEIASAGWELSDITYDLHHSEFADGNIMTEYEQKFSERGNPIHRLVAYRKKCCNTN